MSGPVRPPLTVAETDGTPTIRPCNTITFNSADFVVIDNGATARIDLVPGGGAGASLTSTMIGFGDVANLLTGSSKLVFLEASDCMGLGTSTPVVYSTAATTLQIHDATLPELRLTNTATGAAAGSGSLLQVAGSDFYIWNAEAAKMHFATNSQVVGTFDSAGKLGLGTQTPSYTLDAIAATDDSIARFKSNDANAGIIVDSPNDGYSVIFFAEDSTNKWSVGKLASASDTFSIYNEVTNDAVLKIQADNDMIYNDGNDAATFYMKSSNEVALDIAGSNAIGVSIALDATGTGGDEWRLVSGANSAGIGGGNFGLYNVDASTYVWTAGEDGVVGIGAFPGDSDVERLHVKGTGDGTLVRLESTDTGAGSAPELNLYRSATATTDDLVGQLRFQAKSATGSINITAATIYTQLKAVSGTAMDSVIHFDIRKSNSSVSALQLSNTASVFNAGNVDIDFRIETTGNTNMFVVKSSTNNVGIGGTPDSSAVLHVKDNGSRANTVLIESTDTDDNDDGPDLVLYRNKNSPSAATDLGIVRFRGRNNASADIEYGYIRTDVVSGFGTTANGLMKLGVVADGTAPTDSLYIDGTGSSPVVGVGAQPTSTAAQFQVNEDASFSSYLENQNTSGIVDASLQKNGHVVSNPAGGDITVTLGTGGSQGEKVTITNVSGDSSTVTLAVAVGDSTFTTPAAFSAGDSQTWLCYKDLNWIMINSQT